MRVPKKRSGRNGKNRRRKRSVAPLPTVTSLEEFRRHYLPRAFKAGGLGTLSPKQTGERLAEQSLVLVRKLLAGEAAG